MPIFQDHFIDNRNSWPEREEFNISQKIDNYVFAIDRRSSKSHSVIWKDYKVEPGTEFKVHSVIERIDGGNHGYGLIWRGLDKDNCFVFEISGSGYYKIKQRVKGVWSAITDWEPAEMINLKHGTNEIMVEQYETDARFYINGQLVHESVIPMPAQTNGLGFVVNGELLLRIHSVLAMYTSGKISDDETAEPVSEEELEEVLADLNGLIGLDNIKREINTLVNVLKVQKLRQEREMKTTDLSLHMVLAGPPGTGKTTVARMIGKIYRALGFLKKGHVVETDRAGLVAQYVGQTAPKVDEKVQEAMGGILFIDEAYSLMPRESSGRDFGQEAIEALLKRMEDHRGEFALIIAGYADEMHRFLDANPGVRSRFNRYLFFDHYNPEELAGIFELFCNKGGFELDETAKKKVRMHMAKAYARRDNAFGNGRYARNIFENTIENQANRIVGVEEITDEVLTTFTEEDIPDFDDSDLGQEDTLDEATLMAMLNLDQPVESIGDEPTDLEEIESGQETEEVVEPEAVAEETAEEAAEEKEIQSESDQDK